MELRDKLTVVVAVGVVVMWGLRAIAGWLLLCNDLAIACEVARGLGVERDDVTVVRTGWRVWAYASVLAPVDEATVEAVAARVRRRLPERVRFEIRVLVPRGGLA